MSIIFFKLIAVLVVIITMIEADYDLMAALGYLFLGASIVAIFCSTF